MTPVYTAGTGTPGVNSKVAAAAESQMPDDLIKDPAQRRAFYSKYFGLGKTQQDLDFLLTQTAQVGCALIQICLPSMHICRSCIMCSSRLARQQSCY